MTRLIASRAAHAPGAGMFVREQGILADFCAGLLEAVLERTRVRPEVAVVERSAAHCVLEVRWSE